MYAAVLGLMGIQIACQMTFISIDNPRSSIFMAVFRKFILFCERSPMLLNAHRCQHR